MRQAVVLIHGIGEQKPMGTVRGFVNAVLGEGFGPEPAYWSKPDRMSELFELRRLRSRGRTATDFYEYYWAYNLQGTKLFDLGRWLVGLVVRSRKDVPTSAKSLWLVGRLLIVAVVVALLLGWAGQWPVWYSELTRIGAVSLLVSGALVVIQFVLVTYLGDAARYLSPLPRNIKLRQKIRSEGVALLRSLHQSGDYDRIIVVGHSLGSIIAYDLLTHLWQEYNESLPGLQQPNIQEEVRRCMNTGTSVQPAVRDELSAKAAALRDSGYGLERFRAAQMAAWREQRYFGNGWKITDLITIGSPLTHAPLLMAGSSKDFDDRRRERELPTCPPQRDEKGFAYGGPACDVGQGKRFTPLLLHHAALFAVTRWTNLYFPAAVGVFGDFVGGPLRPLFGLGIKDIEVSTSKWRGLGGRTLIAHTSYWRTEDGESPATTTARLPALYALRQGLDLARLRRFAVSMDRQPRPSVAQDGTKGDVQQRRHAGAPVIQVAPTTEASGGRNDSS